MSCPEQNPCQPCAPVMTTGCIDFPDTDCVKWRKDPIACLDISTGDSLTTILEKLEDVICGLSPTSFSEYNYSCFSSENIQTQEQFVEFMSELLCEILGTQEPGDVTPLSTLATNISNISVQVNNLVNITTLDCFESISGLSGPTASISTLLGAVQQVICDHDDDIQGLIALGGLGITANDSDSIDFTVSGTGNHTITGSVKLSADSGNSLSIESDGLYVSSPNITVADTATIDLTASGTGNHTLQAAVKISAVGGNIIIAQADGIYASAALSETAITANDSTTIDFTASGTSNHTITASVIIDPAPDNIITSTESGLYASASGFSLGDNSVTNAKLRDSAAYSVIGRSTGSVGDPADIVASADGVLRRSGSGDLQFGTIVAGNITNGQVTLPKLQNLASQQVLGRSSGGPGAVEHLTLGSNLHATAGVLNTHGRTLIGITVFTSDGTWTKPSGCNAALVYTVAGGGGGAGADADTSEAAFGGGGGAGGFVIDFIESGLGATETVTVGLGGDGGDSGNSYAGQSGGNSSFGAHTAAAGGAGGTTVASGTAATIGAYSGNGGSYTTNATTIVGACGGIGMYGIRLSSSVAQGGLGGASFFGSWASSGNTSYGAGGIGNYAINNNTADGLDGTDGIVIVYEYS